ncbi:hypothetical protein TNCT_73541 [Trichonephila clavata]|uniref:Uncharacterized protein n=1 Tax=Trichonephila clavata TaxID=2740835 RepID=A0A8X6KZY3_TRICU|nr:hypothetical protein TNCT_73541 [Trichonephila clavata]
MSRSSHEMVWADVVGDLIAGSKLSPAPPTSADHLMFLQELLPRLHHPESQRVILQKWFQHGRAPPHYGRCVLENLYYGFGHRCIRRDGPFPWPPRCPDFCRMHFFSALKVLCKQYLWIRIWWQESAVRL